MYEERECEYKECREDGMDFTEFHRFCVEVLLGLSNPKFDQIESIFDQIGGILIEH